MSLVQLRLDAVRAYPPRVSAFSGMPMLGSRNFLPDCVPAGILSFTRPLSVGTVTVQPRTASHAGISRS